MTSSQEPLTLGAVLYQGFEMLDLYGPLEMLGLLEPLVEIITVAENKGPVPANQGPRTVAEYDFSTCPPLDLILVPGGDGTIDQLDNPALMSFLVEKMRRAKLTMSVCTGSWILAKAGLLDGRRATSNKAFFKLGLKLGRDVAWVSEARWVEDGPVFTASGVSAGMDMSLAAIALPFGPEKAEEAASRAEYVWNRDPDHDPFHRFLNRRVQE